MLPIVTDHGMVMGERVEVTEPPRFRKIRTEAEKLERLRELILGLRHRADSLGHGIAGRQIQHVANVIEGILNDHTIAPVINQSEREIVEADS